MPLLPALALWFAPLVGAMAYDAWTRGRVHGVYWIGLAVLALSLLRLPLRTRTSGSESAADLRA